MTNTTTEASKPAAAQEAVAYLDIGAGGYLDLGSDLPEEQLMGLPKGRHALAIIGTYGIDGYAAAPVAAAPVEPDLDAYDPASGELAAQWLYRNGLEKLAAVVRGQLDIRGARIRELSASTPAAPGIDLEQFREAVTVAVMFDKRAAGIKPNYAHLLALIDASPKGGENMHDWSQRMAKLEAGQYVGAGAHGLPDSPKGGSDACYFSADPALGEFTTHDTLQAAIDSAESMLSDAGDEAHENGWTDDPPQICYGVVLGECVEVEGSRKPAPEGSEFSEHVEFKLQATSAEVGS
ncbi:hypothetical protein [Stenotrophomonas sp. PS02298]|uniref:hypothetical protein n=1 Tax=Stenotrophomonas sp. PS02298 TaxID=2991424 RepID=UPI00249BD8EA|nr:hypothetical protein [Stenotrophomonas sp. PS02298]